MTSQKPPLSDHQSAASEKAAEVVPNLTSPGVQLAPAEQGAPSFYFVTFFDLRSRQEGIAEISKRQSTDRTQLIHDIAGWQWECIDRVLYAEALGKPLLDISEEIAAEVLALIVREGSGLLYEQRGWLETILGLRAVSEACQEHPELLEV